MLDFKNYIKLVSIAKNIARSSGATAGTVANASVLADGEMVVTDLAGRILDSTTVLGLTKVQIRQGRGVKTPSIKVFELDLGSITGYQGNAYSAAVDQVTYIGYNGSTGAIEATGSSKTSFVTKVTPLPNSMLYGAMPFNVKDSLFTSAASTTALNNGIGILKNLQLSFVPNRQIDFNPKFELVVSDASSAITNLTSMLFTRYSKQVTVTASSSITINAGSYLRVGGTGTTFPVFRVATGGSGTSFTITLDWAYMGDSASILGAVIQSIASPAGSVGVKISGIPMRYDVVRWRQYDRMRFSVQLVNGFTTTTVTNAVVAFDGVGTWQQTMNDEYIYWGDAGQINPIQIPYLPREQDAVQGNNYSVLNTSWLNSVENTMVATGRLKGNLIIYADKTSGSFNTNITGAATSLVDVLDAFVTQNSNFAPQAGNL